MAGFTLRSQETTQLRDIIVATQDTCELPLPWPVLQGLRELLKADSVGFTCLDSKVPHFVFQQYVDPQCGHGCESETPEEARSNPFWAQYWGPFGCSHPDTSGNYWGARRASDHMSLRERRGVQAARGNSDRSSDRCLEAVLPGRSPGRYFRVLAYRAGRDFTDRDVFHLELLQPHLERAFWAGTADRASGALTTRQRQVLELARDGLSNRQIARKAGLSEGTVRVHMSHIFERLEVQSRTAAVHRAFSCTEDLLNPARPRSPA